LLLGWWNEKKRLIAAQGGLSMLIYPGLMCRFLRTAGLAAALSVVQASAGERVVAAGEQVSVSSVASSLSVADAARAYQGKDADPAIAANASQSATKTPAGRAMTSAQRPQPKRNRVATSQSAHRNERFGLVAACSELWCGLQHFSLMLGVGF
jgi:hypothetical protein